MSVCMDKRIGLARYAVTFVPSSYRKVFVCNFRAMIPVVTVINGSLLTPHRYGPIITLTVYRRVIWHGRVFTMSTEMATCGLCGSQMPANVRFCPECGSANARLTTSGEGSAPDSQPAGHESTPASSDTVQISSGDAASSLENTQESDEGRFEPSLAYSSAPEESSVASSGSNLDSGLGTGEERSGSASSMPEQPLGTPTVNIGSSLEGVDNYTPPPAGLYGSGDPKQPSGQYVPPQYTPYSQAQAQGQGQSPTQQFGQPPYAPPPGSQYTPPPPQYPQGTGNLPQPYTNYSQAPMGYPPQQIAGAERKDPTTALLLELIGYIGFLGIGHIYAGKTGRGIALMVAWWFYAIIAFILTFVLIGCLMFLIVPIVPIASGLFLKNEMEKEQKMGGYRS